MKKHESRGAERRMVKEVWLELGGWQTLCRTALLSTSNLFELKNNQQ